jgi:hypothetical protein
MVAYQFHVKPRMLQLQLNEMPVPGASASEADEWAEFGMFIGLEHEKPPKY